MLISEDQRPPKKPNYEADGNWRYLRIFRFNLSLEREKKKMLHLFSNLTFYIKAIGNYFVHFPENPFVYIYIHSILFTGKHVMDHKFSIKMISLEKQVRRSLFLSLMALSGGEACLFSAPDKIFMKGKDSLISQIIYSHSAHALSSGT